MDLRSKALGGLITLFSTSLLAEGTPDEDFAARCSAPGVVSCFGFDNTTTDVVRNVNLYPDGLGTFRAGVDTVTKASGGGSLRFDMPPPPHAGANIGGSWVPQGGWGANFSENSTFFIQYRLKLSPELLQNIYDNATWKTTIFHYTGKTCASIELTTSNYYGTPLAQMNTDCGARAMHTTLDGTQYTSQTPLLMQQTDDLQCAYGADYAQNCVNFVANKWMTLYYRVQIGQWGQANSSIDAWIAYEGEGTLHQFVRMRNFRLDCNGVSCDSSPDKDAGYNSVTITPYMTAVSGNVGPSSTVYMWFDEFIVSTEPIALPDVVQPNAPGGVTAN